jgi:hypothetical protein
MLRDDAFDLPGRACQNTPDTGGQLTLQGGRNLRDAVGCAGKSNPWCSSCVQLAELLANGARATITRRDMQVRQPVPCGTLAWQGLEASGHPPAILQDTVATDSQRTTYAFDQPRIKAERSCCEQSRYAEPVAMVVCTLV